MEFSARVRQAQEIVAQRLALLHSQAQRDVILAAHLRLEPEADPNHIAAYSKAFCLEALDHVDMTAQQLLRQLAEHHPDLDPSLIDQLRNPQVFPVECGGFYSPAYLGLLWAFRCMPKKDFHCHISTGVHEWEMAEILIESQEDSDEIFAGLAKALEHEENKNELIEEIRLACRERNTMAVMDLLQGTQALKTWGNKGFFIVNMRTLQLATKIVVLRMILDGVTEFELRLNPIKFETLSASQRVEVEEMSDREKLLFVVKENLKAINRGIDEAISLAKDKYKIGVNPEKLKICLSFDRGKTYRALNNMPMVEATEIIMGSIEEIRQEFPRVSTLDLAGSEFCLEDNEYSPLQWRQALQLAQAAELSCVSHLGDVTYFINASPTMKELGIGKRLGIGDGTGNDYPSGSRDGFLKCFFEMLGFQLRFVELSISLLPPGARIGHGYILSPTYVVNKWPQWLGWGWDVGANSSDIPPALREQVERIKQIIKDKKMVIEHCASALAGGNYPCFYDPLPIFSWVAEGLNVTLGTDGIWYYGEEQPRTLSEEMLRLFLTNPLEGQPLSISDLLRATKV